MLRTIPSVLLAAFFAIVSVPAHAGLIGMHFTGSVFGYFSLPILEDDFPAGTPLTIDLTYEDDFLGLPASQFSLGMAPAISGTMSLGGNQYILQGMSLTYFGYGPTADDPSPNYGFHVKGTGAATDDGEVFSGLSLDFTAATLGRPNLIGFGNTNWLVANNGYLLISGTTTHERLSSPVPSPGTLWLVLAGLGAWSITRRYRLEPARV